MEIRKTHLTSKSYKTVHNCQIDFRQLKLQGKNQLWGVNFFSSVPGIQCKPKTMFSLLSPNHTGIF